MANSAECGSAGGKTKTGPTGPRTTEGKANSSRNSVKHSIFLSGILPEEKEVASNLFKGFQKDFRLRGTAELEINSDLVYCRLVERRIRRYEVAELHKAKIYSLLSNRDQLDARDTSGLCQSTNSNEAAPETNRVRLPTWLCISHLKILEREIELRGLCPEKVLQVLQTLFRNRMSRTVVEIIRTLILLHMALEAQKEDKEMIATLQKKLQPLILEGLHVVIAELAHRGMFEQQRDDIEDEGKFEVVLPDAVLERSERYRSANDRRFSRHLQNLEVMRHLRGEK